jgi:hypothetical protein
MAIQKRRKQTTHSFRGQADGEKVVSYLNDEKDDRSRRFVQSLLKDAQLLTSLGRRQTNGTFEVRDSEQFQSVKGRFNRNVRRYKTVPAFSLFSGDLWHFTRVFTGGKFPLGEFIAVHSILSLAGAGLLDRVRQCEYCHKWLFALFPQQRCCGKPSFCRIRLYQSSETYKKEKREYAKNLYRDKKKQEIGWIAKPRERSH